MATKPTQLDKLWTAWGRFQWVVNVSFVDLRVRAANVARRARQR